MAGVKGSISAWAEEPAAEKLRGCLCKVDLRVGGGTSATQVAEFASLVKEHESMRDGSANKEGTLVLHEILRRLAEGKHLEPSRSPRFAPRHNDAAGLHLIMPLRHHVPDTLAHALAHPRARVDARSQFQHYRAEE